MVLALLAGHLALSVWPSLFRIANDFPPYYLAARAVAEGRPFDAAYTRAFWRAESARAGLPMVGTFAPHLPANALLLLPVARLAPAAAKAVWSAALALLLAAAFFVLRGVTPDAWPWLAGLAFVSQTASIRNALLYGQPYPLLLLLLCASLLALLRGRDFVSGLLLAPVIVLKLYGAPFALFFLLTRRWRALLGVLAGTAAAVALSVALLGAEVHRVYLTQVLRDSLDGRVLDPYSTVWGSPASVTRRLLQYEPDMNPHPVADKPRLARASGRAAAAAIALFAVFCAVLHDRAGRVRLAWATLAVGSLAASPLPSSYHMVLLALPAALLAAAERPAWERWAALGLAALAGSPLVHYLAPLAHGRGNVLAPVRLIALLALLALCGRGIRLRSTGAALALALAGGAAAGLTARWSRPEDAGWLRVYAERSVLVAEPASCPNGISWLTIVDASYRYRRGDFALVDEAPCAPSGLSPDGQWLAYAAFGDGSWDLWVRHRKTGEARRLTHDPANEVEPMWLPGGDGILFASDRRRGLGATALFVIPFEPPR